MKDQIIEASIGLFNEKGINQTTFRDIGLKLGISDGHVRYYYRTKEDLLIEIFWQLDHEIVERSKVDSQENDVLNFMRKGIEGVFYVLLKYQFLFVESPKTLAQYPKLISAYSGLIKRRKKLILDSFKAFHQLGLFQESFTKEQQEIVFYSLFIISDGWIRTYTLTRKNEPTKKDIKFHSDLILNLLLPYLKPNLIIG